MRLNDLVPDFGSKKQKKRLGRGRSSGLGKTCCRGHKGQGARAGVALGFFEGGQNPLYTRLPKRGFVSMRSSCFQVVNFSSIFSMLQELSLDAQDKDFVIDPDFLADKGLIRSSSRPVRLLSSGDVLYPLRFSLHSASVSSLKKIEASGGSFVQVPFTSL